MMKMVWVDCARVSERDVCGRQFDVDSLACHLVDGGFVGFLRLQVFYGRIPDH